MRDLITIITTSAALTGCATPKPRECEDLRIRIERDARTDKIVSVEVLCDGRVIPQVVGSVISVSPKATIEEVSHGE